MPTYALMGFVPAQYDNNNTGLDADTQKQNPVEREVYETEDKELAMSILKDGGFTQGDNEWVVVNEVKMKGLTAGEGSISKRDVS